MIVKGNSLLGKLGIGLLGIFLLFVFIGCEKEKSVAGPTAFNASESSINNAASKCVSKCKYDTGGNVTFKMDDFKSYTGTMYVSVDPGDKVCRDWRERNGYATARIIWGPWETEKVILDSIKKTAIKFQKTKPDSVQLTVITDGCDMPNIKLCSCKPQTWEYWKVYTPNWYGR